MRSSFWLPFGGGSISIIFSKISSIPSPVFPEHGTAFDVSIPMTSSIWFFVLSTSDAGKSTIADRIIHRCGGLTEREMKEQVLDSMDIERDRGITIKAQTVK